MTSIITVLIPNFNRNDFLFDTLNSIKNQTIDCSLLKIKVVDDCSSLENPELVIRKFLDLNISLIVNEKNLGQMRNINKCIKLSDSEYTHILHSDDTLAPNFYEEILKVINYVPEIDYIFCPSNYIDEKGVNIGNTGQIFDQATYLVNFNERLYLEQLIQTPSIIVRTKVYSEIGSFRTDLHMCEDWDMWIRISKRFKGYYIPKFLANYRVNSISTSSSNQFNGNYLKDLKKLQNEFFLLHHSPIIYRKSVINYSGFFVRNAVKVKGMRNVINHLRYLQPFSNKLKFLYYRIVS